MMVEHVTRVSQCSWICTAVLIVAYFDSGDTNDMFVGRELFLLHLRHEMDTMYQESVLSSDEKWPHGVEIDLHQRISLRK